jgi:hypothetical protein
MTELRFTRLFLELTWSKIERGRSEGSEGKRQEHTVGVIDRGREAERETDRGREADAPTGRNVEIRTNLSTIVLC